MDSKICLALLACVVLTAQAEQRCGTSSVLELSLSRSGQAVDPLPGPLVANIRVVIDSRFFEIHGRESFSLTHDVIAEVNTLFERVLGVHLRIVETSILTTDEPLGQITDAQLLLDRITAINLQGDADLVHLFTGRQLDGDTFGISLMGSICKPPYAASITQELPPASQLVATAHEIAHTLGARHDGIGYCSATGPGRIMWPVLDQAAWAFSDCTTRIVGLTLPITRCLAMGDSQWLPRRRPLKNTRPMPGHFWE